MASEWESMRSCSIRCLRSFDRMSSSLQKSHGAFDDQVTVTAVLDELARFRVWAGNIGALQTGRSSLDYRLRDAAAIAQHVIRILKDLDRSLEEGLRRLPSLATDDLPFAGSSIISGERKQEEGDDLSDSDPETEGSSTSSDVDMDILSSVRSPFTELQHLFGAVSNANTALLKLSIAIRKHATRDDYLRCASLVPLDESFDINHVWQKFPYARPKKWLVTRLGQAITRRRQYLKYRKTHRQKLSREEQNDQAAAERTVNVTTRSQSQMQPFSVGDQMQNPRILPSTVQTQTTATTFVAGNQDNHDRESDAGLSETTYATSAPRDGRDELHVPPRPPDSDDDMPFECPYCFTIQTVKDDRAWK